MISSIIVMVIIVIVYACLAIIVFSPTIFAGWFYLVSREDRPEEGPCPHVAVHNVCNQSTGGTFLYAPGLLPVRVKERVRK